LIVVRVSGNNRLSRGVKRIYIRSVRRFNVLEATLRMETTHMTNSLCKISNNDKKDLSPY